jgi:sigma-E factor negative regulatory protein RseA
MQVTKMNEDSVLEHREQVSALVDGELDAVALARLMARPGMDLDVQATWQSYHLIGDVLRGGEQALSHSAPGFVSRLQARLQAEAQLASSRPEALPAVSVPIAVVGKAADSANDASFRWKMVAGCASLAAVVTMVWSVAGGASPTNVAPQLATAPAAQIAATPSVRVASQTVEQPVTLANGEAQVMIRDARLDELLTAHKQVGSGAVLQMPAGFLRSATFATPEP